MPCMLHVLIGDRSHPGSYPSVGPCLTIDDFNNFFCPSEATKVLSLRKARFPVSLDRKLLFLLVQRLVGSLHKSRIHFVRGKYGSPPCAYAFSFPPRVSLQEEKPRRKTPRAEKDVDASFSSKKCRRHAHTQFRKKGGENRALLCRRRQRTLQHPSTQVDGGLVARSNL